MVSRRIAKRKFKGQAPTGIDWRYFGSFEHGAQTWMVHVKDASDEYDQQRGYQGFKVWVNGAHPKKANYWGRWKHKKNALALSKDIELMVEHQGDMAEKVLAVLAKGFGLTTVPKIEDMFDFEGDE